MPSYTPTYVTPTTAPFERITNIDICAAVGVARNFGKFFGESLPALSDAGQRSRDWKTREYVVGVDMENIYDYFPGIKASGQRRTGSGRAAL